MFGKWPIMKSAIQTSESNSSLVEACSTANRTASLTNFNSDPDAKRAIRLLILSLTSRICSFEPREVWPP